MRTTVVAVLVLMTLPFGSSGQERSDAKGSPLRIFVTNNNWNNASLAFYCAGRWKKSIRAVEMGQTTTDDLDVDGCFDFTFTIDLLASRDFFISPRLAVSPGDCISIDVGTRLWNTSWLPCASELSNAQEMGAPTVIYHSAQIVTVNESLEIAETVAIGDGRIVAVGSEETRMIDLGGKVMLPGSDGGDERQYSRDASEYVSVRAGRLRAAR